MKHFKTKADLDTVINNKKPEGVVRKTWISYQLGNRYQEFLGNLQIEYNELYPEINENGNRINYIEYSEVEEIEEFDNVTSEFVIKTKPILPSYIYAEVEVDFDTPPGEKNTVESKPLKPKYTGYKLKESFNLFAKNKITNWIKENNNNNTVNMEPYVDFIKPYLLVLVNLEFEKAINTIVNKYPKNEQKTWVTQKIEAAEFLKDNTAKTPMLDAISKSREIDKKVLANKILEKATIFDTLVGQAIGYRQRAGDMINKVIAYQDLLALIEELTKEKDIFYKIIKK